MATNELKDRILEWCAQASEIAVVQDREEPNAEVALLLRLNRPEGARIGVYKAAVEDQISMLHALRFPATTSLADAVDRVVEARSGWLSGSTQASADGQQVTLSFTLYEDGLTKHAFLGGLRELTRVRALVQRIQPGAATDVNPQFPAAPAGRAEATLEVAPEPAAATVAESSPRPISTPAPTPIPVQTPTPTPAEAAQPTPLAATSSAQPAPTFGRTFQPAAEAVPRPQPSAAPVTQGVTPAGTAPTADVPRPAPQPKPAWAPSHRVPPAGMDAWSVPDPTQRAVARIDGGVPVQVTETAGAWAHVLCSNGWRGWVDYRILVTVDS